MSGDEKGDNELDQARLLGLCLRESTSVGSPEDACPKDVPLVVRKTRDKVPDLRSQKPATLQQVGEGKC